MKLQFFSGLFALIAASFALYSCLNPAGDHYVNIEKPDPEKITIDLAGVGDDTIYVYGNTDFSFQVAGFPVYILESEVKLNDQLIYTVGTNHFTIFPINFPSGFYKLRIKLVGRTGNGSLANLLDKERVNVEGEYNVVIDSDPPPVAEITKLDTTGGTLTIQWNKYTKKNFASYRIIKFCGDLFNFNSCKTVNITDANTTTWTDSEYVGGRTGYQVNIVTPIRESEGKRKEYWWKPKFQVSIVNGMATVSWPSPLFYLNVGKVTINTTEVPHEVVTTATSYSKASRLMFGSIYNVKLKIYSKIEVPAEFSQNYYVGDYHDWPSTVPMLYKSQEDLYYGQNSNGTIIMDNTLKVLKSIYGYSIRCISGNGLYFITVIDNDFYSTDPRTLETVKLIETGETYINKPTVGNNGLIGYFGSGGAYKVISLETGEVKFNDVPSLETYITLSPSGNYVMGDNRKIYHYNGSSFVYDGDLPSDYSTYMYTSFYFEKNDNILSNKLNYQTSHSDLIEIDISTRAVILTKSLSYGINQYRLDPVTGKIAVECNGYFYLLSPTRELLPAAGFTFSIFNNTLFSGDSYKVLSIDCSYVEQP